MVKLVSFHMRAGQPIRQIFVFLLALSLILAGKIPAAHADARILYATPQAIGTGSFSSWGNSCTLQTALTNALSGDQIWASAGRHTPGPLGSPPGSTFQLKDGVSVYDALWLRKPIFMSVQGLGRVP